MSDEQPLGYFYDIQSCPFPGNKDPIDCVQLLRDTYGGRGSEEKFVVVCDVRKEKSEVIKALDYIPMVTIVYCSEHKSAGKLLKASINDFVSNYNGKKCTIVLITSDEEFRGQMAELRYKKRFEVILLHGPKVSPAFLKFPNLAQNFYQLLDSVDGNNNEPLPLENGVKYDQQKIEPVVVKDSNFIHSDTVKSNESDDLGEKLKNWRQSYTTAVKTEPILIKRTECKYSDEYCAEINKGKCPYNHPSREPTKQTECEDFRGVGCPKHAESCPFAHRLENKGIDLKDLFDCRTYIGNVSGETKENESLYVWKLQFHVTPELLSKVFGRLDGFVGVVIKPEKQCAFIRFTTVESSRAALKQLTERFLQLGMNGVVVKFANPRQ